MPGRSAASALLLLPGALLIWFLFELGGVGAGISGTFAVLAGAALLLLWSQREPSSREGELPARWPTIALLLLPGAMTVYFSWNSGGFFPESPALMVIVVGGILLVRIAMADRPFEGFSKPFAVCGGALALFAGWTLLSALWSDAPARALLEFDRAVLYVLILVLFGSVAYRAGQMVWLVRGLALATGIVALAGLASRVLPNVLDVSLGYASERLSYPVGYWNALGLIAALGILLCFHLTCSDREVRLTRIASAAVIPLLASTLLFTFSRASMAVTVLGLVVYILFAWPKGLASGLLASMLTVPVAVVATYRADLLSSADPTSPAAVEQGHDLALLLGLCALGAAAIRALLLLLDARTKRVSLGPRARRNVVIAEAAGVGVAIVVALALGAGSYVGDQYDRFISGKAPNTAEGVRERLSDPANNGRTDLWNAAFEAYGDSKLSGEGAGTFQNFWLTNREAYLPDRDAHSLYFEAAGELGTVGLTFVLVAVLTILVAMGWRARGPSRSLYVALFACGLAWAIHAGVDWDWENPAVTAWLFAAGGAVLAAHRRGGQTPPDRTTALPPRILASLAVLVPTVVAGVIFISQERLDDALDAWDREDCRTALSEARSARSALDTRPEPYEVIGLCEAVEGDEEAGLRAMRKAIDRDPDSWEPWFNLALIEGDAGRDAGRDPRPAMRRALQLNPLEPEPRQLLTRLERGGPSRWENISERSFGRAVISR